MTDELDRPAHKGRPDAKPRQDLSPSPNCPTGHITWGEFKKLVDDVCPDDVLIDYMDFSSPVVSKDLGIFVDEDGLTVTE